MGAVENRAASVAAFKGIFRSPRGRQHLGQSRRAHHTHNRDVPPPRPVQRQAFGGNWAGSGSYSKPEDRSGRAPNQDDPCRRRSRERTFVIRATNDGKEPTVSDVAMSSNGR